MKKFKLVLITFYTFLIILMQAQDVQEVPKKVAKAEKLAVDQKINIDGLLDESLWEDIKWEGDFIQRQPNEGKAPLQKTKFKILYDDKFLYLGIKCLDTEPDKIVSRLSRRDSWEGDLVVVSFDSYHDLQTCFSYSITAAGVKGDEKLSDNGQSSDSNWNPIWYAKTNIDDEGWTAELKIPFSQFRFSKDANQIWGLQFMRKLFRAESRSTWQKIPLDAGGWISNFGELHGLKNLDGIKQIELQPYVLGSYSTHEKQEGNPFRTGTDKNISAGLDGKIGLNNALTLDFTINPDFGQVEADPAALALDGFQLFFNERRPFFIENKSTFSYNVSRSNANNTFDSDNLFYSRRIGKNPSYYPSVGQNEYMKIPNNTTILGAAKVSGQTKDGWNIGIMESVTSKEYAEIKSIDGEDSKVLVEPLTNYFVGRVQKYFNNRNSSVGGILTSTHRKIEGNLDFLHKSAYSAGLDFEHNWKNREWYTKGRVMFSKVNGSENAIANTQQSIGHLFQREDQNYLMVDTTLKSLEGDAGVIKIGKAGGKGLLFESGFTWRNPKFELNDLGFMRQADDMRHFHWMGWRWRKPFSIFNFVAANYNHWLALDYGGNLNLVSFNVNSSATFKNNWNGGLGANINPLSYSNYELRGGPRFRYIPDNNAWIWFETDTRKKISIGSHNSFGTSIDKSRTFTSTEVWTSIQPSNALQLSLSAFLNQSKNEIQYISTQKHNNTNKYIVGTLDRKTLGVSLRINYTINPNFSFQYYGQPFISRGRYSAFKEINEAGSKYLDQKIISFHEDHIAFDEEEGIYKVDADKDDVYDFSFYNPNFAFVQFRSNMVLRWEYTPGSELFFVWSQGTVGSGDPDDKLGRSLNTQILERKMENIFLIKATYRLVL